MLGLSYGDLFFCGIIVVVIVVCIALSDMGKKKA